MANPYASVVILTQKKPEKVLEGLKAQSFQDFEVIIASEKGIVQAMNSALAVAKGKIFIRIDDDVELPEGWLWQLTRPFSDPSVAGVTGPTYVPRERRKNRDSIRIWENPNWFLKWLTDGMEFNPAGIYRCGMVSYDSNYAERFWYDTPMSHPDHLEGTNWAMRTHLIRAVGGFDPKFDGVAEWFDTDVEQKILAMGERGYRLVYNPRAYLYHMLEVGEHFHERFEGWGRIKNFLRFHLRHGRFHWKMVIYLLVWMGYFACRSLKK